MREEKSAPNSRSGRYPEQQATAPGVVPGALGAELDRRWWARRPATSRKANRTAPSRLSSSHVSGGDVPGPLGGVPKRGTTGWLWLTGALSLLGGLGFLLVGERRWAGPLYCIEHPGTLWSGLVPLPAGYTPECPESRSYRQEVRSGQSRVERYRVDGWQPRELLETMKRAGYRQTTDDPIAPGNYTAFLSGQNSLIQYLASLQDGQTVVTLSGRP